MPDNNPDRSVNPNRNESEPTPEATSDWLERQTPDGNATISTAAHTPASEGSTGPSLAAFMDQVQALAETDASGAPPARGGAFPVIPGYRIAHEIARGGMGVVFAAHDQGLDREVAVKTLLPHLTFDPRYAAQFDREARLTASLSHPGVPPVHASGILHDGRPFLAMRLIRGRTLADELASVGPGKQVTRLMGVFEQICQTVGYAHSLGLVHRDLKPGNVMVGAFGEVQVMDWGLAKRVATATPIPPTAAVDVPWADSAGEIDDATQMGSAKGTPAYMPPEQARGEWDTVDSRADVFALGGILNAVLTGKPPYSGTSRAEVMLRAERGDLREAFARLDACEADPELVALCKRCLDPVPANRPADGKAVADAVAAYRAGVEERARRAEAERAAAEVEAREQRKRRKVQLALGLAIGLLATSAGAFAWWQEKQREEKRIQQAAFDAKQEAQGESARKQVAELLEQAASARRDYRFSAAERILDQAGEIAANLAPNLVPQVDQAKFDLRFVRDLDEIRMKRSAWKAEIGGTGRFDTAKAPEAYRKAFAARGLNVVADPTDSAARIRASAVREDLVAALDDWAVLLNEDEAEQRAKVLTTANLADPDSGMSPFRDPTVWKDQSRIRTLTRSVSPAGMTPAGIVAVAEIMKARNLDATRFLGLAITLYPRDFLVSFTLGQSTPPDSREAAAAFRAARAIRPDNVVTLYNLGNALQRSGDLPGAIAAFRNAVDIAPNFSEGHNNLGGAYHASGDVAAATTCFREAIKQDPQHAASHYNLGIVLHEKGDLDGAVASWKEAIRWEPRLALAHYNLGNVAHQRGQVDEAMRSYREAIRHDPTLAMAHANMALLQRQQGDLKAAIAMHREAIRVDPNNPDNYYGLGTTLTHAGDYDGAIAAFQDALKRNDKHRDSYLGLGAVYGIRGQHPPAVAAARTAIRLDPTFSNSHALLGEVLLGMGDIPGAREAFTEAIRLDPQWKSKLARLISNEAFYSAQGTGRAAIGDFAGAVVAVYRVLGREVADAAALFEKGSELLDKNDLDGAIDAFRESLRLFPKDPKVHTYLGLALGEKGDLVGATESFREAVRLNPKDASAHSMLGFVLKKRGDAAGAIAAYRQAVKLAPTVSNNHYELGSLLKSQGDAEGAMTAFKEAFRLNPKDATAALMVSGLYNDRDDLPQAIAWARSATRADPKSAFGHVILGELLKKSGDIVGARTALTEGVRLAPKYGPLLAKLPLPDVAPPPRPVDRETAKP
jgi:tetratricopeptide (TPR) repeat protein